jgi:hypothetical protein
MPALRALASSIASSARRFTKSTGYENEAADRRVTTLIPVKTRMNRRR